MPPSTHALSIAALAAGIALLAKPAESGARPPRDSLPAAVDAIAEAARRDLGIPGLSIAVLRGRKVVLAKGYGVADRAAGTPASERTIYPIGSISKAFTATAVMKLVEQGRVRLDDPVVLYLPEFPVPPGPPLRIRDLLRHTSGIPNYWNLPELERIYAGGSDEFTISELVQRTGQLGAMFPPGERFAYSNSNYLLLVAVIERVTGKTLDRFLAETLYGPLRLHATRSCDLLAPDARRAEGYDLAGESFVPAPFTASKARHATGSGGLCSTAGEVAAWMRALVDGRAVSAQSYREMTSAAPVRAGYAPPYGFGLSLIAYLGEPSVSHTGVVSGFTSMVAYFPRDGLTIVVLTNRRHTWVHHIVKKVARAALGLPEPLRHDRPVSEADLGRLAGTYDDGMFKIRVFSDAGRLNLHVEELGPPRPLHYQGGNEFATAEPEDFRLWFEPASGPAARVVFEWLELHSYGRRVP